MHTANPRSGGVRRSVVFALLAVLVVLVAWGSWVGVRAVLAKDELTAASRLADDAQASFVAADYEGAEQSVTDLAGRASSARDLTGDVAWRAAETLPFIGNNLTAVRVASAELDAVSQGVLLPLVPLAADAGSVAEGLNLGLVASAQPALERAASIMTASARALGGVDRTALLAPVAHAVEQFDSVANEAAPVLGALEQASALMPGMLGHNEPRSVLVVFQNSAELRSSGGLAGAFVEFSAVNGSLTLVDQASSADFTRRQTPIVDLPGDAVALYGDQVGLTANNVTMTPDFELAAQMASAWWNERTGHSPDSVLTIDPLTVTSLLALTGPIDVDGGQLTVDNAAEQLLVTPYLRFEENEQQDAFFQSVVSTVFRSLTSAPLDPMGLAEALKTPLAEGRISAWSAHADEQSRLAAGPLAGPVVRQREAGDNAFAVYFNDATGAKLDTFLETAFDVVSESCRADGRRETRVSVTLTSTVPADAADAFPARMTGDGHYGVPDGSVATYVAVSAPAGSFFDGVRASGTIVPSVDVTQAGFPTSQAGITLAPGETSTLEFSFISGDDDDAAAATLLHTPLYRAPTVAVAEQACS